MAQLNVFFKLFLIGIAEFYTRKANPEVIKPRIFFLKEVNVIQRDPAGSCDLSRVP